MAPLTRHPLVTWLQCCACGQWLPATSEFFSTRALNASRRCRCRECTARGKLMRSEPGLAQDLDVEHACVRCGQSWPLSREFFRPLPHHPGQLNTVCRACESEARLRRAGRPHTAPTAHETDVIAPLLTGAHFFKGAPA